jgi:hypothetical protein
MPRPLPLPLADGSLIVNGRAQPDACSSAALATISALSASLAARVRLRAGSSTTISFPFLFSRPISITESNKDAALRATSSEMVRAKHRTLGVRGVDARVWCKARGRRHGGGARRVGGVVARVRRWRAGGVVARVRRRRRWRGGARACRCRRRRRGRCAGAAGDGAVVASRWHSARVQRGRCGGDGDGGANDGKVACEWQKAERRRTRAAVRGQERYMTCGPRGFSYRRLIRRLGFERRLIASV